VIHTAKVIGDDKSTARQIPGGAKKLTKTMADKDGGLISDSENLALFGMWTGGSETSRWPRQRRSAAVSELARAVLGHLSTAAEDVRSLGAVVHPQELVGGAQMLLYG
jgi:hypothetical protein